MYLLVLSLLFVITTVAQNVYDIERGIELGTIQLGFPDPDCPIYAVSPIALNLHCPTNFDVPFNELEFELNGKKLSKIQKDGRYMLYLDSGNLQSHNTYVLKAKSKTGGNDRVSDSLTLDTEPPKAIDIGQFSSLAYNVSSGHVVILNSRTILINDLWYNGKGPDAFFWVGTGSTATEKGAIIPDENGKRDVLGKYEGEDVVLHLPHNITADAIDYLSIWCRKFKENFGEVIFPKNLRVPPSYYEYQNLTPYTSPKDHEHHSKTEASAGTQRQPEALLSVVSILLMSFIELI